MSDVAPETFATPDDLGELHASELHTPLMESLGAQASEAFMGGTRTILRASEMFGAEHGVDPLAAAGFWEGGGPAGLDAYQQIQAEQNAEPDVPIADANARVKQEGLEGRLKLPQQDTIRKPVLDLMLAHAHERAEYEAAVNRGPQGFLPDALGFVTQMGAGMIDPVNVAAFSIPVLGEARYGQILARAGDSLVNRFAVKAGVGAAQGAVGGAALLPADWWLRTQDGQDYTFADALKSVVLSAGMGAAFMGGHGTVSDLLARYRRLPLSGSPADLLARGLSRRGPAAAQPIIPLEEVPGVTAVERPLLAPLEGESAPEGPKGVFDDVLEQLRAAGMGDQEAQHNAAVVAARYETRAARMGGDAYDLYRGEGLTIQRPSAEDEDFEGRTFAQKAQEPGLFAEREAEGQQVLPGAERIGEGELAQRRADQPLKPKAEQKPMDIGLFGDEANQKTLFQAPAFYSAAERAITASKQEKASPEQWLATIKNTPGVKSEELHWLGLEDWLKEQKGPVTKQAIADYVRGNQIELKEVEKGAQKIPMLRGVTRDELNVRQTEHQYIVTAADGRKVEIGKGTVGSEQEAIEYGHRYLNARADEINHNRSLREDPTNTKFGSYQLPGGENYRELLLTLPTKTGGPFDIRQGAPGVWSSYDTTGRFGGSGGGFATEAEARADADARNREARFHADAYKSPHWDEPNVLAHVRFNDRTIDGKRTLFVEEIQSDWHQKGKREGYQGSGRSTEDVDADIDALLKEAENIDPKLARDDATAGDWQSFWDAHPEMKQRREALYLERPHPNYQVPDAPFKTNWPELALKRMIRYAAENGYDKIAWTPGDVQAARYDLSKHIQRIVLHDNTSGGIGRPQMEGEFTQGYLTAFDHEGRQVISQYIHDRARLPELIGKEAADKLLAARPGEARSGGLGVRERRLENADLKIGDEGMAGFYDKILPAAASKLVKKFGAKVERRVAAPIAAEPMPAEIAPGSAEAYEWLHDQATGGLYLEEHNGEWQVVDSHDDNNVIGSADTERAAQKILDEKIEKRKPSPINAHVIDLTPQLRDAAVRQGFPLFQEGEGAPRGRITLAQNRAIVDLFANADRSTFMHEAGHLWLEEMVRDAGAEGAPQGVKDDLSTILNWLSVDKPEAIGTEQHEQFARGFEQYFSEGKAPSSRLAQAFEKFKDWLLAIYHGLASFGAPLSDDVRGVMDRMLATDKEIADWRNAPPHPAEVLADLPPSVQENVVQAAAADIINGRDVRAGEMLNEGAKEDPRIAESLAAKPAPAAAAENTRIHEDNLRHAGDELDSALRQLGEKPEEVPDSRRSRVLEIMTREGIAAPLEAYERAIMEEDGHGVEAGVVESQPEKIPGWDDVDEAGAAPGEGGAAAQEPVGEGAGGGARPRAGGADAGSPRQARGVADWKKFGEAPPPVEDRDFAVASKLAEAVPEPASIDTVKAPSAAEAAADQANKLLDDILPRLSEDERKIFEDALKQMDMDNDAREQIVREGAQCLAEAGAEASA